MESINKAIALVELGSFAGVLLDEGESESANFAALDGGVDEEGEVPLGSLCRFILVLISACLRKAIDSSKVICAPVSALEPVMVLQESPYASGSLLSIRVKKEYSEREPGWAPFISV